MITIDALQGMYRQEDKLRWYNFAVENQRQYRPELISRRGEKLAWSLASVSVVTLLILLVNDVDLLVAAIFFVVFLVFSAVFISLGNWMDRRTLIDLHEEKIAFRNGLRDVSLTWDQIKELRILPSRWGERIQVIGDESHFEFRTLGEVTLNGDVKGRLGFKEGQAIRDHIVKSGGLEERKSENEIRYYARP